MPLMPRKSASANAWVVEIGASHVAAAEFNLGRTLGLEMPQLCFRDIPPAPVAAGPESQDEGAKLGLREVLKPTRPRGGITLVLPGHLVITKLVRVPAGAEAQREQLIAFEAKQALPFALKELYWAARDLGIHAGEREILIIAAKRSAVDEWVQLVLAEGGEVNAVIAAGVAMLGAVPTSSTDTTQAIANIGARSAHLVFRQGGRLQMRTLALAGSTVTRAIADRLNQEPAEAERLKRGVMSGKIDLPADTPAGGAVVSAGDSFAARLQLELNRSIVTQIRQAGLAPPQQLILAGGGSMVPGLGEALQRKANLDVSDWSLEEVCEVGAGARSEIEKVGAGRLIDLVGAGRAAVYREDAGDLSPPEVRAGREAKKQRPRWVLAAVMLIVATTLPGLHFYRLKEARLDAARDLQRRAVPVEALRTQNQQRLDEFRRLRIVAEVLAERVSARHAWEGLLADLETSVIGAGDVWLERLLVLPPAEENELAGDPLLLRLRISGRLLDRENPLSRVSQASYQRATQLIESLLQSPRVNAIEGERFDASDPGILRFDFTLVMDPDSRL